jgi:hypothetical protein
LPRRVLVAVLAGALVVAAPAGAHVIASPTFLFAGETRTLELSVPNERDATMTGFVVTAPPEVEIVGAESAEGWAEAVDGRVATWSGGSLPAKLAETFGLTIRPPGEPGAVELEAEQRYADGTVPWPVSLTIVPGNGETSSNSGGSGILLGAIVAVGVAISAAIGLLAWRRRSAA